MIKKSIAAIVSIFLLSVSGQAEEFKIPKAQAAGLIGEWKVIKMGKGEDLEDAPGDRKLGMTFKEDGTGSHVKGDRERAIKWGADAKGVFAAQWVKEDGRLDDGIMGSWEITNEGLLLKGHEYEDGQGPPEKAFTVLMVRVDPED